MSLKTNDTFDVAGSREHIERLTAGEVVSVLFEHSAISCEGVGGAGDVNYLLWRYLSDSVDK